MASKITFTQKEEDTLRETVQYGRVEPPTIKHLQSLLAKMEKAHETKVKFSGISVASFLSLAVEKLPNLKRHPNPTTDWFIKMQRAINSAGITEELAIKGIAEAARIWKGGDIWVEQLIYSLAKLSAGVQGSLPFKQKAVGFTPDKKSGWLGRLGDNNGES